MRLSKFEDVEAARDRLLQVLVALEKVNSPEPLELMVVDGKGQPLLEVDWMESAGEIELKVWEAIRLSVQQCLLSRVAQLTAEFAESGVEVDLEEIQRLYVSPKRNQW